MIQQEKLCSYHTELGKSVTKQIKIGQISMVATKIEMNRCQKNKYGVEGKGEIWTRFKQFYGGWDCSRKHISSRGEVVLDLFLLTQQLSTATIFMQVRAWINIPPLLLSHCTTRLF